MHARVTGGVDDVPAADGTDRADSWVDAWPGPAARNAACAGSIVVVAAIAATFAHFMREGILGAAERLGDSRDVVVAATSLHPVVRFGLAFGALLVAGAIGRAVQRRHRGRLGVGAVAAAARGEGDGPVLGGTLVRAGATFIASASMVSIGREAAIMETGGTIGHSLARRLRLDQSALAAAGIGAAFAAAYHAPMSGLLYVEEHLGVRRRPRAALATAVGASIGHLVTVRYLHGHTLFARLGTTRLDVVRLGAVALLPATIGSRLFLLARERVNRLQNTDARSLLRRNVLFAAAAAFVLAWAPTSAGNGMEAIRHTATGTTIAVLAALGIAKVLATGAALGSGAPGGAFSPTMAVSVGWALAAFELLHRVGVDVGGNRWAVVLAAMSIGIAVGLESPLVGAVIVAEMTGDLAVAPFTAVVVLAAVLLDRVLVALVARAGADRRTAPAVHVAHAIHGVPVVHDEDG